MLCLSSGLIDRLAELYRGRVTGSLVKHRHGMGDRLSGGLATYATGLCWLEVQASVAVGWFRQKWRSTDMSVDVGE